MPIVSDQAHTSVVSSITDLWHTLAEAPLDEAEGVLAEWLHDHEAWVIGATGMWPLRYVVYAIDPDYVRDVIAEHRLPDLPDDGLEDIAVMAAGDANETICETDILEDVLDARIVSMVKEYASIKEGEESHD